MKASKSGHQVLVAPIGTIERFGKGEQDWVRHPLPGPTTGDLEQLKRVQRPASDDWSVFATSHAPSKWAAARAELLEEDIDATWEEQGFNSRSEFLRYTARDAVKHPEFSREGWKQIAASEHELRTGKEELVSREEVLAMMNDDTEGE